MKTVALLLVCSVGLSAGFLAAQNQAWQKEPHDPFNRLTPQSSMISFLDAARAKDYDRAMRYLNLEKLSPERQKLGPDLARQLEQILDRDPQFDVAALSENPEGGPADHLPPGREKIATYNLSGRTVDLQLAKRTLRSGVGVWLLSPESVDLIPSLAQSHSESFIEPYLPAPLVNWTLVDTPLWRWIALLLVAAIVTTLSKLLSRIVLLVAKPACDHVAPRVASNLLEATAPPLQILLAVAAFRFGMEWIALSGRLKTFVAGGVSLLTFLAIAWLCARVIDVSAAHLRTRMDVRHQTFSRSVLPLASRVLKVTVLVLGITAVLSSWGYNTNAILTGLGIGGIAIALAAQKTIENLFGGVAMITDRPVAVGDFCKFGDRIGTVEDIGLRSTRIRTLDRTMVTVPNAEFSAMTLENFNKRDKVLFAPKLSLRRDTTPEQVRKILKAIERILKNHPKIETGELPVRFVGVGTYSLDLEIFTYGATRDYDEFLEIQQDLLLQMMDAITAAGAALALPTQASILYPAARPDGATRATENVLEWSKR
jgi:MscS family membrane protein